MNHHNGNIFCDADEVIIRSFCFREAGQFRFRDEENGRAANAEGDADLRAFVARGGLANRLMLELMSHTEENPEFNYARIQSITNAGALDSELVLSTQHLGHDQGDLIFMLPPSPHGKISVYRSRKND